MTSRNPAQGDATEVEFLARYAGLLLLMLGCALIVLSVIFIEHETVASIFAFTGVASAVLGIVFSRAEGPIEIGPAGLKATITRLSTVAKSEDLTLEDKGEILATTLGDPAQTIEPQSVPSAEAFGTPKLSVGGATIGPPASAFVVVAMEQFASEGWEVERAGLHDEGFDFKARRGNEVLLVEVKARRRLAAADIRRLLSYLLPAARSAQAIPALVVPLGSVTPTAMKALADTGVRLIEVPIGNEPH